MTFEYICISVTNLCNQSCDYCFRLDSSVELIDEDVFISCLSKLKTLGCKMVNISGGEPLLHNKWRSFVKCAHDMGFHVVLSTNGLLLDLEDEALKLVDEIAISLDGSCNEINSKFRGNGHFDTVKKLIDRYRESDYPFKLKVGTVMTQENYNDLDALIPILDNADIYWRVFFCKNKGSYNHLANDKQLCYEDYRRKIDEINAIVPAGINFMYDCCIEDGVGNRETTLVSPAGDLYISDDDSYERIGDLSNLSANEIEALVLEKGYSIHSHKYYYDDVI